MTPDDGARLRELEDRAAITDLLYRYCDGVRDGDSQQIASCFTDDSTIRARGGNASRQSFLEGVVETRASGTLGFDHWMVSTPLVANIRIEVTGDAARCESLTFGFHGGVREGRESVIVRSTVVTDDLVRTSDGWKIRLRLRREAWQFEVPGTMKGEVSRQP